MNKTRESSKSTDNAADKTPSSGENRKFKRLPPKKVIHSTIEAVQNIPKSECFKSCLNECMLKASLLCDADQQKLKEFNMQSSCDTKNSLLAYLWAQDKVLAEEVEGFVFAGELYCLKAFSKMTGISEYLLRQVTDYFERGLKGEFYHEGRNASKLHAKSVNFISWFQLFAKSYGQDAPDEELITLPSFLTMKNIWQLYKEECFDPSDEVGYSTVVKLIRNHFGPSRSNRTLPRVRFSANSTHSKCDICSDLNIYQRSAKTQQQIDFVRALKYKHKQRYGCQRIQIEALRNVSQRMPEDQMSVYMDGMDNFKGYILQKCIFSWFCIWSLKYLMFSLIVLFISGYHIFDYLTLTVDTSI